MPQSVANKSLEKALVLLQAIAYARGKKTLQEIAAECGIPLPTACRIMATLEGQKFLHRGARGRYVPGRNLLLLAGEVEQTNMLTALARPVLQSLSRRFGCVAHLGILENDMVTYLAKEGGALGYKAGEVPTREGTQLEAYCSAIGKVLLAELPKDQLSNYIAAGQFVPLTRQTITQPAALRDELKLVANQGYAIDAREVNDNLTCIAKAVRGPDGAAIAALSLSLTPEIPTASEHRQMLRYLRRASATVTELLQESP